MNINIKELPNFIMNTEGEETIINETSFVESPATGFNFLKFAKSDVKEFKFSNLETKGYQRMASGLWFAPDTKYIRNSGNMYYTVEFKKEDLKEALLKYLKSDFSNNVKVEHKGEYQDGFISMEHWIYENENTLSPVFGLSVSDLGYDPSEIKVGSIFKTVFVESESFWNEQVLTEKVNGFSIGGLFNLKEEKKAFDQYFSTIQAAAVEAIKEEVIEIKEEVIEIIAEDSLSVVSAEASLLDEKVEVVTEEVLPSVEIPAEIVKESPELSAFAKKLEELSSKLENYISENSLLKTQNEQYKLENALKEDVIAKQAAHLKDSPIKNTNPAKSATVEITPDNSKKGKMIGNIWVPFD